MCTTLGKNVALLILINKFYRIRNARKHKMTRDDFTYAEYAENF